MIDFSSRLKQKKRTVKKPFYVEGCLKVAGFLTRKEQYDVLEKMLHNPVVKRKNSNICKP